MDGVKCVIVIHEMGEIFMRVAIASDHGGYRFCLLYTSDAADE